mmetsp:Transcript_65381/g.103576  ORF Transcript_65381/g.103576 Transcript_65381/m.103576 type:complete len:203 (+) Transcript_65381:1484-2092(+)
MLRLSLCHIVFSFLVYTTNIWTRLLVAMEMLATRQRRNLRKRARPRRRKRKRLTTSKNDIKERSHGRKGDVCVCSVSRKSARTSSKARLRQRRRRKKKMPLKKTWADMGKHYVMIFFDSSSRRCCGNAELKVVPRALQRMPVLDGRVQASSYLLTSLSEWHQHSRLSFGVEWSSTNFTKCWAFVKDGRTMPCASVLQSSIGG